MQQIQEIALKYIVMGLIAVVLAWIVLTKEQNSNRTQHPRPSKPKIINGYTLPPEPDPKINNATLLGVDSNNNGIRDDVERFIIKKYKDHHKAVTEIGFQIARAYQKILANPLDWEENHKLLDWATDCNFYYKDHSKYFNEPTLIKHYIIDDTFKNLQLNTKSRVKAYLLYDRQLSGGVYRLAKSKEMKEHCSQEVLDLVGGAK